MKQSRTLRLTSDRLSELTPAELDRLVAGYEGTVTTPTACIDCLTERVTPAIAGGPNNLFTLYTCR